MSTTVTRCPKCDTSFRITDAHLKSAKGAVRCGSCLHIFNARDYIIEDEASHKEESKSASTSDDENVLIDDKMGSDEDFYSTDSDSNVMMSSTFGPSESNLFERDAIDAEDEDDLDDPDESWAESLLAEDDEGRAEKQVIKPEKKPKQTKRELFEVRDTETGSDGNFYGTEPPPPPGSKLSNEHFQLIDNLRENEKEYDPQTNQNSSTHKPERANEDSPTEETYESKSPAEEEDSYLESEEEYIQTPYENMDYSGEPQIGDADGIDEIDDYAYQDQYGATAPSRYLESIEPEPVEFNVVTNYPIWQSKTLWTTLACLAGFLLFLQVAIFRFDDLSVVQPWRSHYAKACSVFSCDLPQLRDRSLIKATNLVVRSHPNIEKALMVDAILRNSARFPQVFPPLDLVFTNIKNEAIAARRFEAKEYLGGELAGKNDMPIDQPIHIAFEISDPGPEAVSYFISIPD